jgi:hypothetical protein
MGQDIDTVEYELPLCHWAGVQVGWLQSFQAKLNAFTQVEL